MTCNIFVIFQDFLWLSMTTNFSMTFPDFPWLWEPCPMFHTLCTPIQLQDTTALFGIVFKEHHQNLLRTRQGLLHQMLSQAGIGQTMVCMNGYVRTLLQRRTSTIWVAMKSVTIIQAGYCLVQKMPKPKCDLICKLLNNFSRLRTIWVTTVA